MSTLPQTDMNDHPVILGVMCSYYVDFRGVAFLDWDYSYESVVTQIPHIISMVYRLELYIDRNNSLVEVYIQRSKHFFS